MILVWTRPATLDRRKIREHVARDNPGAALTLDALFSEKAALLARHPGLGRPGRVAGTRELVAHPSYLLIYDVTPGTGCGSCVSCMPPGSGRPAAETTPRAAILT